MPFKDLLVHVDSTKAYPARLDAAIHVAQSHEAHLTGLYVLPLVNVPGYAEAQIPLEVIETQRQNMRAQADKAEKAFRAAAEKANIASEWRCVEDDVARALSMNARYVDLVLTGQDDKSDPMSMNGVPRRCISSKSGHCTGRLRSGA